MVQVKNLTPMFLIAQAFTEAGRHKQALLVFGDWIYQGFSSSKGNSQMRAKRTDNKVIDSFFHEFGSMTPFIAKVEQGRILSQIHDACAEVRGWWEA
jgi:hypothetical protein